MKSKIFGTVLILTLISCSNNNRTDNNLGIEGIKLEVHNTFEKFTYDLNSGNLSEVATYYLDHPDFYWVENGTITYPSTASARKAIIEFYPMLKAMDFRSSDQRVTIINHSTVLLYVDYQQELMFQSDQELKLNGAMTILLKKDNGIWKFVNGHTSVQE